MEKLKIKFVDFWPTFNPTNNAFWNELGKYYHLELCDQPNILFYSVFGKEYLKYPCHRIFYTGENIRPNFNECDIALSFDYNNKPQHIRLPLYTRLFDLEKLKTEYKATVNYPAKTKFCCMLVSNPNGTFRNEFFHQLCNYKQVDSGGAFLNNIGGRVANKQDFIQDYKFVLSFENSEYPGYTTEKIVEPMLCGSIPIYWGNPLINKEFDSSSFVNLYDYVNIEEAMNQIITIDQNNELFAKLQRQSNLINDQLLPCQQLESTLLTLKNKMEEMMQHKPIANTFKYKYIRFFKH